MDVVRLLKLRDAVRDNGGYFVMHNGTENYGDFKCLIRYCLSEIPEKSNLAICCSKRTKVTLLEWFCLENFNYLGTRIVIESLDAFEELFPDKFTVLAMNDGKEIGWLEFYK